MDDPKAYKPQEKAWKPRVVDTMIAGSIYSAGSGWPPLEQMIPAAKGRTRTLGEAAKVDEPFDR